jgi:NTP pyrophosphatase (non-canonical NTP hydrolase)
METVVNLSTLQTDQAIWAKRNFGSITAAGQCLGVVEEFGELVEAMLKLLLTATAIGRLAHAVLKAEQGIRGSREQHMEDAADAIGDTVIYLCGVATCLGIDMEQAVTDTWASVSQRDWRKHPESGRADGSGG